MASSTFQARSPSALFLELMSIVGVFSSLLMFIAAEVYKRQTQMHPTFPVVPALFAATILIGHVQFCVFPLNSLHIRLSMCVYDIFAFQDWVVWWFMCQDISLSCTSKFRTGISNLLAQFWRYLGQVFALVMLPRLWQPLEGPLVFVFLQVVGWTLYVERLENLKRI